MTMWKKRVSVLALALAFGLILSACASNPAEAERTEPTNSPTEDRASGLISCEYSSTGDELGGYTALAIRQTEEGAEMSFASASGADAGEIKTDTAICPDLLEQLWSLAETADMRNWQELPPTEGEMTDETVSSLRLTWDDGHCLFVSSRDQMPEGGIKAFQSMIQLLYTAQTPDGQMVFGGEEALVDLSKLAEAESAPESYDGTALSENAQRQLDAVRRQLTEEGADYALALLGYPDVSGGSLKNDRGYVSLLLEAEGYSDYLFLSDLPAEQYVETDEGTELFLLITCNPESEIQIFEWLPPTGESDFGQRGNLLYEGKGELPLLLRCNVSDIIPEVEVELGTADGNLVCFQPFISLQDGSLSVEEHGRDISNYRYAVG